MSKIKAVNKQTKNETAANEIRYNGKMLAESRHFAKNMWAATVALDPNGYYTLDEADELVTAFLNRKVG